MSSVSNFDIAAMGMEMMSDEEHPRRWDPSKDSATSSIWRQTPSELLRYNAKKQVFQLQMKPINLAATADRHSMVVHIDGVCHEEGTSSAYASYGIYFGPGSKYNNHGPLDISQPQTQDRVDIEALSKALDAIYSICGKDYSLSSIYIAISSESLFETITDRIYDWVEDDGIGAHGKEVENFHLLKCLHELLQEKEYGDNGGIEVRFWYRPSEEMKEVRALTLEALN